MKYPLLYLLVFAQLAGYESFSQKRNPVDYVDNFIGVRDKNTSCVLGPQLPNATINPSPHTAPGNVNYDMDCYIMGQPIRGFAQLHVSGTGWGKYGQIFLSPQVALAVGDIEHDSPKENETAKPYEYAVTLSRYGIQTKVTPATHCAMYQFTFPATDSANILLDISHNITDIATAMKRPDNGFINGQITFTNNNGTELKGYGTYRGGFSDGDYKVFFCARINKAPQATGTWKNGKIFTANKTEQADGFNQRIGAYTQFSTKENESILLKIAVSFKSIEQAAQWLYEEIPDWNYNKVKNTAKKLWNKELSKITVKGGSDTTRKIFYTAAYHANIMPRNKTNDAIGFEVGEPVWDDHLAAWDTWRTLYPLKVLTNPDMVSGTINSFIARWKKSGKVKDAYVALNDMSAEQGGNNIDNIIADAYVKGVAGVDWNEAYRLIKHQADKERLGISSGKPDSSKMYKELGWIPAGKMSTSVSLEYSYNDFCAAQIAKGLGKENDYKRYLDRSSKWTNLWNPTAASDGFTGFISTKRLGSDFIPIDLKKNWGSWKDYFYEGSSWTYSYFVPHQFEKLVELSGGKINFAKKLQYGFENNLIDYGNEPAFLAVHAFHYANRSDLASYYTRKLLKENFSLDGCKENDDSGAMSSWYIFSAMGFFPNAGQDIYYLTGSSYPYITIRLANGKQVNITANNASDKNIYIQSCKINGKVWKQFWFTHNEIKNGGTIEFVMGDKAVL